MVGDKQQVFAVGVNGGATHTRFVVIDSQLGVSARATAGSTNFHNIGFETACKALARGITEAIDRAGVIPSQVAAIGAGLSGVDDPVARARFREALETAFPAAHILIDHDAIAALVGGTGAIVFGIDARGKRARAGGWGYHLDQGGGYAIVREALTAITRTQNGLGPVTGLTERIASRLGLRNSRDLVDWLYAPERRIDEIAALATDTVALAEDDSVASGIFSRAADALAGGVIAVAQQLDFAGAPFPLLMSGSVFDHSSLLRDLFVTAVRSSLPDAVVISAAADATVGAALMAFQSLGMTLPPAQALAPMPPQRRPTEQRNRLTGDSRRRATLDPVLLMNQQDQRVARVIEPELPRIAALIDAIAEWFSRGGRLLLAGAGTSGRLAVLNPAECVPTFNTLPDRVIGILARGQRR